MELKERRAILYPYFLFRNAILTIRFFIMAICFFLCFKCYPHGGTEHVRVYKNILEGVSGENISSLYKTVTKGIDYDFYERFRKKIGTIEGNHRIIGHWGFEGPIPFEHEPWRSVLAPYPREEVINLWRQYANELTDEAVRKTGLPRKQAQGLVGLLYNTHLIDDRVPGNKIVDPVIKPDLIIRDIKKNLHRLFGNNSSFVKEIETEIAKIKPNTPNAYKCKRVEEILCSRNIGEKFFHTHQRFLKAKDISYNKTIAVRMLERSTLASNTSQEYVKALQDYISPKFSKISIPKKARLVTGVLQKGTIKGKPVMLLSVPIKNVANSAFMNAVATGVTAGVATFVFAEGYTIYKFAAGDISDDYFEKETLKNLTIALATGAATLVTVALGAHPTGWVVLGVGIGTAIIVDFVFDRFYDEFKTPTITLNDILGKLPTELQRRKIVLGGNESNTYRHLFEYHRGKESVLDPVRDITILDGVGKSESGLEINNNKKTGIE